MCWLMNILLYQMANKDLLKNCDFSSKDWSLDPWTHKMGSREIFVGQKRMDPCLAETVGVHFVLTSLC